jgi:hypothetical protein
MATCKGDRAIAMLAHAARQIFGLIWINDRMSVTGYQPVLN